PHESRRKLLDKVIYYLRSGNAGVDDFLYEVTHATCYDDQDWRHLAARFEVWGREYALDQAMEIYRKIGDDKKYLELRLKDLKYGLDYYDLVAYYQERSEPKKALEVAREGLKKGQGRLEEIRAFLANYAQTTGDRETYME